MGNPSTSNIGAFIKPASGTVPVAASAGTRTSDAIDRMGFGSAVVFVQTGAAGGTPTTQSVTVKVQDSDDGSTGWADYEPDTENVATASAVTAVNSSTRLSVNLGYAKRYIRLHETVAFTGGTSPTLGVSSSVTLGGAVTKPTT